MTEEDQEGVASDDQLPEDGGDIAIIALDEFLECDFEAPIRDSDKVEASALSSLFQAASKKSDDKGETAHVRVFDFLEAVTSIHFKPAEAGEPYGPTFEFGGKRSFIPSDFAGEQAEVFAELVTSTQNPALRALLADIAWLNDRTKAQSAREAIGGFCECVERVSNGTGELYLGDNTPGDRAAVDMLQRACQIASMTGWKDPEAARVRR